MTIKLRIKENRIKKNISLRELSEDTGIERHRLSDIEEGIIPIEEILFIEMIVIADNLGIRIFDLYDVGHIEIKGLGEF